MREAGLLDEEILALELYTGVCVCVCVCQRVSDTHKVSDTHVVCVDPGARVVYRCGSEIEREREGLTVEEFAPKVVLPVRERARERE